MRILLIGATHGNEVLGVQVYQELLEKRSEAIRSIDFIIGNPRAYVAGKRYIECDLNRSYGSFGDMYEQCRAREIEEYVKLTNPDIILDIHTTTCVQPSCLIVQNMKGEMKQKLLRASHIENLLQVQPMGDITTVSDNVVGYEISIHHINKRCIDSIVQDVERLVAGLEHTPHKRLFEMQDKIYANEVTSEQAKTFVNFKKHELGYVPILTGENSYKLQTDYIGYKATAKGKITV